MHCLDCGMKLENSSYTESTTKWHCSNCYVDWFQTRRVVVEWTKKKIVLDSENGGIHAPISRAGGTGDE